MRAKRRSWVLAAFLLALGVVSGASEIRAGGTAPALAIQAADATPGSAGTLVRVRATFPAAHLVQHEYELQLLIAEDGGARFVCFSLGRGVLAGETPSLLQGLDQTTVWDVMDAATPIPDGRLLYVGQGRIEVLLPSDFPAGAAVAYLFLIYDETDPVLSNPLPFVVDGAAP